MYSIQFPDLNTQWQVGAQVFEGLATILAVFIALRLALRGEEARVKRNVLPLLTSDIGRTRKVLSAAILVGSDPILTEGILFGSDAGYLFREHGVSVGALGSEITTAVLNYYEGLATTVAIAEGGARYRHFRVSLEDASRLSLLAERALEEIAKKGGK